MLKSKFFKLKCIQFYSFMVGVFTGAQAHRLLSSAKLNPETIAVAATVQEQPPPTFGDEEK